MDDLISRLRKAAHIEPEEVAELMEEAADALEAARDGVTSPVTSTATSPVRILIDAIESEIRQLEGKANWMSQTARISSLRSAIDAAQEARNG